MDKGADLEKGVPYDISIITPLKMAVRDNDIEMVRLLIEYGVRLDCVDVVLFFEDLHDKNFKMVELLISNDQFNKEELLFEAIQFSLISVVQWLIEHGVDINKGDIDGFTPVNEGNSI